MSEVNSIVAVALSPSAGWKYPGQYDYRKIVRITDPSDPSGTHRHVWQIEDYVDVHANRRALMRFEVIADGDRLGFAFENNGTLAFWPHGLNKGHPSAVPAKAGQIADEPLLLVPPSTGQGLAPFVLNLQSLSTSDWYLLRTLCDLMIAQYAILMMHERQFIDWFKGLQQFAQVLQSAPATLRFDGVSITRLVQQDGYAHLGLLLNNVLTERGRFQAWEFRLATVAATGVFDANPRLEFARGLGEVVFERWFVESTNAFGEKLEVRFTKQDQLVDLPLVMVRLTDTDRRVIAQLVSQLPQIVHKAASQTAPAILQKLGSDGPKVFDAFRQVAVTMRTIWNRQIGAV